MRKTAPQNCAWIAQKQNISSRNSLPSSNRSVHFTNFAKITSPSNWIPHNTPTSQSQLKKEFEREFLQVMHFKPLVSRYSQIRNGHLRAIMAVLRAIQYYKFGVDFRYQKKWVGAPFWRCLAFVSYFEQRRPLRMWLRVSPPPRTHFLSINISNTTILDIRQTHSIIRKDQKAR